MTTLPFLDGSEAEIESALRDYTIGLTVSEAKQVAQLLGRDPTVVEAVIWGIQGSEHCSYKSSKRFLSRFPTKGPNIILGPSEDSGIVAITDTPDGKRWGIAIAHESHNHPSQIVPYEGAATGVGGVVRDVVCMGARVIGCMDMLRLGDMQSEETKSIAQEVTRGIAGYGNPLGIPNLGGDTMFDARYNTNCLVNAIALGLVREDEIVHSFAPEQAGKERYDIILVGKPTDRSGFGGASFASVTMEEDEREKNSGAVQEPNPFLERHLLTSCYALFDWLVATGNLHKISCKDLGAGGVVCATVEQVADCNLGARVNLDNVHTSIDDLPAEVIACAETQERLCFTCHPSLTQDILTHFNETWNLPSVAEHAKASVIGYITDDDIYEATHAGEVVCSAKAKDMTCGLQYERSTKEVKNSLSEPDLDENIDISDIFKKMLAHPNGCSREFITKHYDKNVIGNTTLEPGEADAGVIIPLQHLQSYVYEGKHPGWELPDELAHTGIALAADGNGRYGRISPYAQGLNATVEAMCNVAAVGATPRALTDCLNYGNPEIPQQLWELEQGIQGIADAANGVAIDGKPVPIISGNVSLYNSTPDGSSIDPTAIVCCVGVMRDGRKAVSQTLKQTDSHLYLIGERKDECGGSLYYEVMGELGANVPSPNLDDVRKHIECITAAIDSEWILSVHDISDGGLLMALFEMTVPQRKIGGTIGCKVDVSALAKSLRTDTTLFSQTHGFILEVSPSCASQLKEQAQATGVGLTRLGTTSNESRLTVHNGETTLIDEELKPLHSIWQNGLRKALK